MWDHFFKLLVYFRMEFGLKRAVALCTPPSRGGKCYYTKLENESAEWTKKLK